MIFIDLGAEVSFDVQHRLVHTAHWPVSFQMVSLKPSFSITSKDRISLEAAFSIPLEDISLEATFTVATEDRVSCNDTGLC